MDKSLIIAVDAGKSYTKCLAEIDGLLESLKFRTKVKEVENLGIDMHTGNFLVELEGASYLIGDMVDETETSFDVTKTSLTHKISIYLAIGLMLKKLGLHIKTNISLVIGAPLNVYKNSVLKEEYLKYVMGQKCIVMKINDDNIDFTINDILILPESIGPIYKDVSKYKNRNAIAYDIGGLNVNISSYRDRVPELEKMIICNKGINILRARIAEIVNTKLGIVIDDKTADDIVKDRFVYLNGGIINGSRQLIDEVLQDHITEIVNYSKSRGYNPFNTNADVIFTGGGSILLNDIIQSLYPTAIIEENAQYANVQSFYNVGRIKLG